MSWTNDYIRIPFVEHGRDRDGVDCWGLVRLVYFDRLGIDLPTLTGYANTKDKLTIPGIIGQESSLWQPVSLGAEKELDVAVFRICGVPMHVGIVVKPGIMLHSECGSGTYVANYLTEMQWVRRLEGFYRYAECSN